MLENPQKLRGLMICRDYDQMRSQFDTKSKETHAQVCLERHGRGSNVRPVCRA